MNRGSKISLTELFVFSASYIPWWLCIILSLLSFLLFNAIWEIPTVENYSIGIEMLKAFSFFARIIFTILFLIGGIASLLGENRNKDKNIRYISIGMSFSILIFFYIIYRGAKNTVDVGNFPVKKEIAAGIEVGSPFKFDIWQSGMGESEIIDMSRRNNITLYKETDEYRYVTKLFNEQATIKLYLTVKSRRLMKLSINWVLGKKVEGAVLEIVNKKNPIEIKKKAELLMKNSIFCKIDERNQMDIERLVSDITLIYKDIALIQQNKTEMQIKKKEIQQNLIDTDGKKF